MPQVHVVQQGECLFSLARRYGFASPRHLLELPENEALRALRKDPGVLHPGDRVFVPDPTEREESVATEQVHVFEVKTPRTVLRLKVDDGEGNAYASRPYELALGSATLSGTTDGDGGLEHAVPVDLEEATLTLVVSDEPRETRVWRVAIGHLDPVEEPSGIAARLANLGLLTRGGDEGVRAALKVFQHEHGLEESGEASEETRAKLLEIHGS